MQPTGALALGRRQISCRIVEPGHLKTGVTSHLRFSPISVAFHIRLHEQLAANLQQIRRFRDKIA